MKKLLIVFVMLISTNSFGQVWEEQLVKNDSTFVTKVNQYYSTINPIQKWYFVFTSNLISDNICMIRIKKSYTKEQINNFCDSLIVVGLDKIKKGEHISNNDTPNSCVFPIGYKLESLEYQFTNYNN